MKINLLAFFVCAIVALQASLAPTFYTPDPLSNIENTPYVGSCELVSVFHSTSSTNNTNNPYYLYGSTSRRLSGYDTLIRWQEQKGDNPHHVYASVSKRLFFDDAVDGQEQKSEKKKKHKRPTIDRIVMAAFRFFNFLGNPYVHTISTQSSIKNKA
ncbi:MAG: hypothetical protein CNLJKLNK_00177 [Holosporales bacterium]